MITGTTQNSIEWVKPDKLYYIGFNEIFLCPSEIVKK
jgi:hypothetical protein